MEQWRKDARSEASIVDPEALVPKDHLLRKIEKVMDYDWLYERPDPYYRHTNGRPGTDPVHFSNFYRNFMNLRYDCLLAKHFSIFQIGNKKVSFRYNQA